MEIEPDSVVSSDGFAKYGNNERCRVSKERVQDFLDRGLMSQGESQDLPLCELVLIHSRWRIPKIHRRAIREAHQRQTICSASRG